MDSLSQIVLGAAVGELMLGRQLGNRAQLLGAIAGTIPDLDVFLNFLGDTDLEKLKIHRGYSHAVVVHLLLAWPLAAWTSRFFKQRISFWRGYVFWVLGLVTHALLDAFTTYGTQLLLPFTDYLVGFNSISVVDLFWTLPFMAFIGSCLFLARESNKRRRIAQFAMLYAVGYLSLTLVNKAYIHQRMHASLEAHHIGVDELSTSPNFLHNFLWSGVGITSDTLYFAEYSLFQKEKEINWVAMPRHQELIKSHPAQADIETVKWFSQGKYLAQQQQDTLFIYVSKWGRMDFRESDPAKTLFFKVAIFPKAGNWKAEQSRPSMNKEQAWEALAGMYSRLWTSRLEERAVTE